MFHITLIGLNSNPLRFGWTHVEGNWARSACSHLLTGLQVSSVACSQECAVCVEHDCALRWHGSHEAGSFFFLYLFIPIRKSRLFHQKRKQAKIWGWASWNYWCCRLSPARHFSLLLEVLAVFARIVFFWWWWCWGCTCKFYKASLLRAFDFGEE